MNEETCRVCSAPAQQKCSACRQVAYCGREHQKQDWKKHKDSCKPFEVRSSSQLGRYLVATRELAPGSVILSELPLVVGAKLHDPTPVCVGCLRPTDQASQFRCPRCLWPLCSPTCPADPKGHAPECALLRLAPINVPIYEALTPLRCLLLQRKHPDRWKQLMSMEAHVKQRGIGTEAYKEARDKVVNPLCERYLRHVDSSVLEQRSPEVLQRICGALDVNALEIRAGAGWEVLGLYPSVSLMEHSCVPNTRHRFDSAPGAKQWKVVVSAATPIRKGDHISTMYTHALWGTHARRDHLKTTKYFSCECRRCEDPTELGTFVSAMRCLGSSPDSDGALCGGTQLPISPLDDESDWRCDRCPVTLSSAQVAELVGRIGEDVDDVQQSSPTVKELEDLLHKISMLLHPHHYHCYSVKHSLVQLYGHQQGYQPAQLTVAQLQRKIDICRDLLQVTATLDPGSGRLSLYSVVLQYELHSALVHRVRKKLKEEPATATQEDLFAAVQEARELLHKAETVLQPEPDMSAESKMAELVRTALRELDNVKG